MTLRQRLSGLIAAVVLSGLLLFGALAYLVFSQQQQRQLTALVTRDLERLQRVMREPVIGSSLLNDQDGLFSQQLVASNGEVVIPAGATALPLVTQPGVYLLDDRPVFVASKPWLNVAGNQIGTIRLALDIRGAMTARRTLLFSLVFSGGIIAALALAIGVVASQRALRPLTLLAQEARGIDPAEPHLTHYQGPDDEVAAVAHALNSALQSIRARQQAERGALAEVAHELAAPLTLVHAHLQALQARYGGDERLLAARDAAAELLHTSQDLLTLARGELDAELHFSVCDLREVLTRLQRDYPGIHLVATEAAEIAAEPQRLTQLLRNLIRNAVQASGSESGVRVKLKRCHQEIIVEVADNGPGIAPEEIPRLFERFYSRRGGVGVGLSVAKRIAHRHGGNISVIAEGGRGACFRVHLPGLEVDEIR